MSEHLSEAEARLLRRIVLGELDPGAEEARRAMAASAALAEAVEEWRRLDDRLAATRRADDALIESARDEVTAEDRGLVFDALRGRASAGDPGPRATSRSLWIGPLVAAAALLVVGVFLQRGVYEGPTAVLGSDGCVRPRGVVSAYSPFVVDVDLGPGWRVEIDVEDARGAALFSSGPLSTTTWELSIEDAGRLAGHDRIRWRYTALDRAGDPMGFGACEAALAP